MNLRPVPWFCARMCRRALQGGDWALRHIESCPACRSALSIHRGMDARLRAFPDLLPAESPPDDLWERVAAGIESRHPSHRPQWGLWAFAGVAAASLALGFFWPRPATRPQLTRLPVMRPPETPFAPESESPKTPFAVEPSPLSAAGQPKAIAPPASKPPVNDKQTVPPIASVARIPTIAPAPPAVKGPVSIGPPPPTVRASISIPASVELRRAAPTREQKKAANDLLPQATDATPDGLETAVNGTSALSVKDAPAVNEVEIQTKDASLAVKARRRQEPHQIAMAGRAVDRLSPDAAPRLQTESVSPPPAAAKPNPPVPLAINGASARSMAGGSGSAFGGFSSDKPLKQIQVTPQSGTDHAAVPLEQEEIHGMPATPLAKERRSHGGGQTSRPPHEIYGFANGDGTLRAGHRSSGSATARAIDRAAAIEGDRAASAGRWPNAAAAYLRVKSPGPEILFKLGNAYLHMNRNAEARRAYENALKRDPHFDAARRALDVLAGREKP